MLKSFRIGNFRNLVNVEFRPVGANLLIGPNNAGKTNLCAALRFISLTSQVSLEQAAFTALGKTWNIGNVYVDSPRIELDLQATIEDGGAPLDFQYELKIEIMKGAFAPGETLRVDEERLLLTGGEFKQTPLLECRAQQASVLHEESFLQGKANRTQTQSPPDATVLSRQYDLETNRRTNLFKRYLRSWQYYNLDPHALRSPSASPETRVMNPDGSGMVRVLFTLHNERPRTERKIIESLKTVEPKADLFTFVSPDPQTVFMFLEDQETHRFGMQSVSDGTLRYLAMSYVVHDMAESRRLMPSSPVVIIEEPENGLYVGQLKPLLEKIDPAGANGQFIFTSHSPYFIDLFEKNLRGVHVMKPGKPSAVLTVPDEQKVGKLLEEMPLGELHFREMLS